MFRKMFQETWRGGTCHLHGPGAASDRWRGQDDQVSQFVTVRDEIEGPRHIPASPSVVDWGWAGPPPPRSASHTASSSRTSPTVNPPGGSTATPTTLVGHLSTPSAYLVLTKTRHVPLGFKIGGRTYLS